MKNWNLELTVEGKTSAEVKVQRGILQGDALTSLLFVITMMLLNYILRNYIRGYKFPKS